ncbi:VENN motif pre-toxin domain-containing protein [Proteus terrae]|uniref:VENN motif pre-toxin domain-containing protein n=2 Tax=Proteus terrae TaxID=1574161 RepID=UPI00301D80BB
MGNNIVTAIANGSAPYLANEVKNQIQGNSVESDIQRTIAHGLLNAGLALAKGENAVVQASGAMTGETVGILSHSLYGKTPEELTETEKQNISAWATLTSGIVGGLISDNSTGVANAAQAGKVVVENNWLSTSQLENFAHKARTCVGEECQQVIRDMVDANIRQQEEIKQICSTSPEQCKQQYGYLVEQWNAFDTAIKHLAADKSLPDDFRDYLPAVYMLSMDATGITVEHQWAKRFEAIGLEPETAGLIAMALPGMINGGSGKGTTNKQTSIPVVKQRNVSKDKFISPENPGITQSRVNVANVTFDNGKIRGFDYAMGKHGIDASVPNKSRFTVTNNEVKELLQRPDIVNKTVYNPIQIGGKVETDKFVRQVDTGKSIGVDQSGKGTSVITIITDKKGNLINVFPGSL